MLGKDKIKDSIVLKNDKNGMHKIINGMLDAYYFFLEDVKAHQCVVILTIGVF